MNFLLHFWWNHVKMANIDNLIDAPFPPSLFFWINSLHFSRKYNKKIEISSRDIKWVYSKLDQ